MENLPDIAVISGAAHGQERHPSAHIVPQDAADAVVLVIGARQARSRPVGQVRAGFAAVD